ncbi:MAG TPA: hypothetical protein VN688_02460 [Gemmataceae bacterium]|nr:hypothetical protein [Gemmataceae bacterium]
MSNRVWVDPRLPLVRVAGVRSYLLGRGWHSQPYPGPELLVFEGPAADDGQPIIQVLPSSEQMRDFPLRVEELIADLSILEDRLPRDILSDMLNEGAADQPRTTEENGSNAAVSLDAWKWGSFHENWRVAYMLR